MKFSHQPNSIQLFDTLSKTRLRLIRRQLSLNFKAQLNETFLICMNWWNFGYYQVHKGVNEICINLKFKGSFCLH